VYRQRWGEVGKSDSEEDEDDDHDSFTVSEEDNNEEGKKYFMGFYKLYSSKYP
jgi:hypothetical protein